MDQIGENVYVVQFDDKKISPVNVERIYSIVKQRKESNNSHTKRRNAQSNKRRRGRKRSLKQMLNDQ